MDGTHTQSGRPYGELGQLKALLFANEHEQLRGVEQRLAEQGRSLRLLRAKLDERVGQLDDETYGQLTMLLTRIDALHARTGTPDRLRESVTEIIDAVLRDAEVTRHKELSAALAPLLVNTIKVEISNNREEMVEVLYPITGRLVKAYVANAIKDLMTDINRRLDARLPGSGLVLRMRSLATGRPMAELALAETQTLEVVELFLARRDSGALIAHWQRDRESGDRAREAAAGVDDGRNAMIGGLLSAITSFAETAFEKDSGSLRRLDRETDTIYLRATPVHLLAARCRGTAPAAVEQVIDNALLGALERHVVGLEQKVATGPHEARPAASMLPDLAEAVESEIKSRGGENSARGKRRLGALVAVVLAPILAWFGWAAYGNWATEQARQTVKRELTATSELRGYPIHALVENRGNIIVLSGLVPHRRFSQALVERIGAALPQADIETRFAVLPTPSTPADIGPDLAALRGISEALARRIDAAQARSDAAAKALAQSVAQARHDAQLSTGTLDRGIAEARSEAAAATRRLAGEIEAARGAADMATTGLGRRLEEARHEASSGRRVLDARIDALAKPSPLDRLTAWTTRNAVFFGEGSAVRDPAAADRTIGELVRLLGETDATLRVVGFTDEQGGATRNAPLARQRAQVVRDALLARGVSAGRLVVVGRNTGPDISPDTGAGSPNRRVQFEIGFPGERGTPP